MDFQKEVIERSSDVAVVVDFWAPWCGPCQFLGPVIEELEKEYNGKWQLVKINTDENQEISSQYGIRGIPAVKMFSEGKVIAEFNGALPKPQLKKWLDENLPSPEKKRLAELQQKAKSEGSKAVVTDLEKLCEEFPELEESKMWLAELILEDEPERALELSASVKSGEYFQRSENIKELVRLLQTEEGNGQVPDLLKQAASYLKAKEYEKAVAQLLEAVMIDKSFSDELPRKATIAMFQKLGADHEVTKKYRRRFDMALY